MTFDISVNAWANPERGRGVWTPPPENHKKYWVFSNTGPGPLKNQASIPFKWRFAGGPMMAHF